MANEPDQQPLRIGVIGCGGIAQCAHLPAIRRVRGAELVAVCDVAGDLALSVGHANALSEDCIYDDHAALLARSDIDAVAVCAWTPIHAELSVEALRAGKHVIAEKPMANSTADAERMVAAARDADRILMIAYNHSYDLATDHVKGLLDRDELGDLLYGELFFYDDKGAWHAGAYRDLIRSTAPRTRPERREVDATTRTFDFVQNYGSHLLSLMRILIGDPVGIEYCSRSESGGLWAMLDYGSFKVFFKNVLSRQRRFEKGIELVGTRKRLRLDLAPPLQRYTPGKVTVIDAEEDTIAQPLLPDRWPFELEWEHFVECVREGREPLTSGARSVKDVTLAEQIAEMA